MRTVISRRSGHVSWQDKLRIAADNRVVALADPCCGKLCAERRIIH